MSELNGRGRCAKLDWRGRWDAKKVSKLLKTLLFIQGVYLMSKELKGKQIDLWLFLGITMQELRGKKEIKFLKTFN